MTVLFEDENLIVCVKPAGVLSEKGAGLSMPSLIEEHTGGEPFTVHRLDRETMGITVYAKTRDCAAALSQSIRNGGVEKEYLAVVCGTLNEKSGSMTDYLLHDERKNLTKVVPENTKGAKKAELEYEIIAESGGFSLARIVLITGRTHQIRAQFSSRGCPLYGDRKYGGCRGDLALCACSLAFTHPVTGEKLRFEISPDYGISPWNFFKK